MSPNPSKNGPVPLSVRYRREVCVSANTCNTESVRGPWKLNPFKFVGMTRNASDNSVSVTYETKNTIKAAAIVHLTYR